MKLSKMKKLRRYLFCFLCMILLSVTLLPANAYAATSMISGICMAVTGRVL
ncbi:hypothetical protein [Robinsoniella peoriensis]